jgi:thiamine biosynthesis protein ThiS
MEKMEITVNGERRTISQGLTVSGLLAEMGIDAGPIAVEVNEQIVPKAEHAETPLAAGDKVEIVSFVGGG